MTDETRIHSRLINSDTVQWTMTSFRPLLILETTARVALNLQEGKERKLRMRSTDNRLAHLTVSNHALVLARSLPVGFE